MDLDFLVGPEALIPRKETELLGRTALNLLHRFIQERGQATVIDLCTGSGNLAIALASHAPACRVYAADLSADAISLARQNAAHLKVNDRVEMRNGDLFTPFDDASFFG